MAPTCEVEPENVLRVRCAFDPASDATLAITDPEGVRRTFRPEADLPGSVFAWDLLAETAYDVALTVDGAAAFEASLTTGPLPEAVAIVATEVVAGPSSLDRVLLPFSCRAEPHLVALDAQGRVRWYQGPNANGAIPGFDLVPEGVALLLGRSRVLRWTWDGRTTLSLTKPGDFDTYVHHTVDFLDGRLATLTTRPVPKDGVQYLVDQVVDVDPAGGLDVRLDLQDLLPPEEGSETTFQGYWTGQFPGAADVYHTNSVDLLPDGGFLLSIKHVDTIVRIDAAGALVWALAGSEWAPEWDRALTVDPGPVVAGFEFQHHANLAPWGNLLLVDNNSRFFGDASVVEYAIDETALRASPVRRWSLDRSCPTQSSAYGLADGSVLAACAATQDLFELDDAGFRRELHLACASGQPPMSALNRALPFAAPGGE